MLHLHMFHITPSKYDFSNKFVLKIAAPQQWTSTFVSAAIHTITSNSENRVYLKDFITMSSRISVVTFMFLCLVILML